MKIIKETENVIFYENKFGGVDFKLKVKDPRDIIESEK